MNDNNFGYWECLDVPYRIFCMASKGDLKSLCKSKFYNENVLEIHWNNIQREYFAIFGISDEYKMIAEKQKRLMVLRAQFSATYNRKLLNDINRIESEIQLISSTARKSKDADVFCAELSEKTGIHYNADMASRIIFGAVKAINETKNIENSGKGNAR